MKNFDAKVMCYVAGKDQIMIKYHLMLYNATPIDAINFLPQNILQALAVDFFK